MNAFLVCSAILVIAYFLLAFNVSRLRLRTQTSIGLGNDPSGPLAKAVRAHGNAAEYTPLFVAMFFYFLLSGAGGWIAWVAIGVTVSRILHALGMLMARNLNGQPHPLRTIGAAGTYIGGLALGLALLLRVLL